MARTPSLRQDEVRRLRDAVEHLEALAHGDAQLCTESAHATESQRRYLDTWVLPTLRATLQRVDP